MKRRVDVDNGRAIGLGFCFLLGIRFGYLYIGMIIFDKIINRIIMILNLVSSLLF